VRRLRLPGHIAPGGATAPLHERLPVVPLKRDGDKVTRIQVRCSARELVGWECVY
jgi:hypothetical protein